MPRQLCVQHSGTIPRPVPRPGPRIFCGAAERAQARSAVPQRCGKGPGIGAIDGLLPSRGPCRDVRPPSHGSRAAGYNDWWLFVRCGRVHLQLPCHLPGLQVGEGSNLEIDVQARNFKWPEGGRKVCGAEAVFLYRSRHRTWWKSPSRKVKGSFWLLEGGGRERALFRVPSRGGALERDLPLTSSSRCKWQFRDAKRQVKPTNYSSACLYFRQYQISSAIRDCERICKCWNYYYGPWFCSINSILEIRWVNGRNPRQKLRIYRRLSP